MARQKGIKKEKVGFSIDKSIIDELENYCIDNSTNKSMLVNKLLKQFLDNKKILEKS